MNIRSLIEGFLNKFAWPATTSNKGAGIRAIVCVLVTVCLVLCVWMSIGNIPQKFVLMIDEFTIKGIDAITIGSENEIAWEGVPSDYLTVTRNGDSWDWEVDCTRTDTLQYFKINNKNPNLHTVKNDANQKISVELPMPDGSSRKIELTGADIWKEWKHFSKQENVLLRQLVAHNRFRQEGTTHADSVAYLGQLDNNEVQSFFNCTHGKLGISGISLVILDKHTTIDGEGYKYEGSTSSEGEFANHCKVQFFRISSYCYKDDSNNDGYFEIAGVNYAMKPTVKLSRWGAGHVMIEGNKDGIRVIYPKAIGFVGTVDSLKKKASYTSDIITFQQTNQAFPTKSDLFIPLFSTGLNHDICDLHMKDENTLKISDNNNNEFIVENAKTWKLPFSLIPALKRVELCSGNDIVSCRTGYINGSFIFSYLWLPLAVFLVLLLIISPKKWSPFVNAKEKDYRRYLGTLTFIAMAYCVCKSLIALKLSYSYPYFENITAITPLDTSMMLLVYFTMVMIINYGITSYKNKNNRRAKPKKHFGVLATLTLLFVGLCAAFFMLLDQQVSRSIIDSYFPSNMSFATKWMIYDEFGVNDNHRTVPYALISVEALLLCVLYMINIFGTAIFKWCSSIVDYFIETVTRHIKLDWRKLVEGREGNRERQDKWNLEEYVKDVKSHFFVCGILLALAFAALILMGSRILFVLTIAFTLAVLLVDFVHDALIIAIRTLGLGHIALIIMLALGGSMLGNFGTAFISLCVILGLTMALRSVKFMDPREEGISTGYYPRHVVLCVMLIIAVGYMLGAMVADNGYMTNFLGFVMYALCVYFIQEHPGSGILGYGEDRKERKWVNWTLGIVALLIVAMPYICSHAFKTDEINYGRASRRVMLYSNFDNLQKSGFRYAESDAEFMVIMSHYLQEPNTNDPLSNDVHSMHASVSSGQAPVILNDLSVPVAFLGAYGVTKPTIVLFLLLIALVILVIHYSCNSNRQDFDSRMGWRLLAMFMWVGTTLYIYFSYIDFLPFTGRLIPGFGVDAVGEALETAFLLSFMAAEMPTNR